MSAQLLEQTITAKDAKAVDVARQLGLASDPVLREFLQHPDGEVRELTLSCVNVVGGPSRNARLIAGLTDDDINVRSAACRHLEQSADAEALPDLLVQLRSVDTRTLEARELIDGQWTIRGCYDDTVTARIPPFQAVELVVDRLFLPRQE